jgi:hypothetical protein
MGRIRRGGYVFEWWIGDHEPRHVHVSTGNGRLLGRVALNNLQPLDDWIPPKKVLEVIADLEREGRL